MNLQITINHIPHIGQAHPTRSGLWVYLKGIALPGNAMPGVSLPKPSGVALPIPSLSFFPFTELLRPLPPNRINGGFLEIGEWQNSHYALELPVDFYLAPDGSVWAKVCDTPECLPTNPDTNAGDGNLAPQADQLAFEILRDAEVTDLVMSTIRERAVCGSWPDPKTPADFLAWIEDEAAFQETYGSRPAYVQRLQEVAERLHDLGITPAPMPWQGENKYAQAT